MKKPTIKLLPGYSDKTIETEVNKILATKKATICKLITISQSNFINSLQVKPIFSLGLQLGQFLFVISCKSYRNKLVKQLNKYLNTQHKI